MTFLLMFSYFDNNCHKIHKKLNICKFTKITLNPLNFLTPLCVSARAQACVRVCGTSTVICYM